MDRPSPKFDEWKNPAHPKLKYSHRHDFINHKQFQQPPKQCIKIVIWIVSLQLELLMWGPGFGNRQCGGLPWTDHVLKISKKDKSCPSNI